MNLLKMFDGFMASKILISMILAGVMVSSCGFADHLGAATWRYKMTVIVETPEGLKQGSAVREIHAFHSAQLLPERSAGHADVVAGEAVSVDLGKRGILFALMRGSPSAEDYGWQIVFDAFPYKAGKYLSAEADNYYQNLSAGPVSLPPDHLPMFVRFKNPADPATVEGISATNHSDVNTFNGGDVLKTFESAFGNDVRLHSVTIEMTKERPTKGILATLPWLANVYGYISGKHITGRKFYEQLDSGDFIRGDNLSITSKLEKAGANSRE